MNVNILSLLAHKIDGVGNFSNTVCLVLSKFQLSNTEWNNFVASLPTRTGSLQTLIRRIFKG